MSIHQVIKDAENYLSTSIEAVLKIRFNKKFRDLS